MVIFSGTKVLYAYTKITVALLSYCSLRDKISFCLFFFFGNKANGYRKAKDTEIWVLII